MSKTTKTLVLIFILGLLLFSVAACSSDISEIESIKLSGDYRNVYIVGEDLDLTGMELVVSNSDGTESTVKVADIRSEIRFLNVETDRVANQLEITVEYKKQKTTFTINVVTSDADETEST